MPRYAFGASRVFECCVTGSGVRSALPRRGVVPGRRVPACAQALRPGTGGHVQSPLSGRPLRYGRVRPCAPRLPHRAVSGPARCLCVLILRIRLHNASLSQPNRWKVRRACCNSRCASTARGGWCRLCAAWCRRRSRSCSSPRPRRRPSAPCSRHAFVDSRMRVCML